jgi:hypothetical protein
LLISPKDFDWGAPYYATGWPCRPLAKKARRLERQNWAVRKSTTATTVHGEAARVDEAQLCDVVHAAHYKA